MSERKECLEDLLRRANRGDAAAYARFLAEVTPLVRIVVRARSRCEARVEDILQEVLLAVHVKRHTWRESDPVAPWLYAIARYKTADAYRGAKNGAGQVQLDDMAERLADERQDDPTAALDLRRLLDEIDDRSARIVRSVGLRGESAGDIGARIGMTEGAVRVAYHRAMNRLRKLAGAD